MSKSEHVKRWREATKKRMISAMGGKCSCCDYAVCDDALDFHHLDPSGKDFSLSSVRTSPISWAKIIQELRKCILLCCRCHREIHAGVREIPEAVVSFNENFADYRTPKELLDMCPQCGSLKPKQHIYCSLYCSGKSKRKVDWDNIDLIQMVSATTIVAVADSLGVSDMAVRKRLKKLYQRVPGTTLSPKQ